MVKAACLLFPAWLAMSSAQALIHGDVTPPLSVATVPLVVEQSYRRAATRRMEAGRSECSAVIVGSRPLTVLTAAIYAPFEQVEANLARDIAVLVFDGDAPDGVDPIPVARTAAAERALLCGYGQGRADPPVAQVRCAWKPLLAASDDFYRCVPQAYEQLDPLLHLQFRAQFEAKQAMLPSASALLAVLRLEGDRYREALPMPTRGDSGGPWIVLGADGRSSVLALTSFVETFYRKNKQWPFFSESTAPLIDRPYVAYGVRLDTREATALLANARRAGADIRTQSD